LKYNKAITKIRVEEAMSHVDRAFYVDNAMPYVDEALSIGFNATISSPHMHALGFEFLEDVLLPGNNVLDIGCGSGFATSCLAKMVLIGK